jgi:hypothetical protein
MRQMSLSLAVVLATAALLLPVAAQACAVCGDGPGIAGDPTARGFYWGILFLMVMPFAVAGSVGGWLLYRYWRTHGPGWLKAVVGNLAWTQKETGP